MKTKIIPLFLLTLGICSVAVATEYKDPDVTFKKRAAPSKEMKTSEFGEHYKVDMGNQTDRQIASEESERDPSSLMMKKKKNFVPEKVEEQPANMPKPWLYKSDNNKEY